MNLVLYGAPGAGKGTQAELLVERYNWVHLSTGNLLREELQAGTELGRRAKEIIARGELVPDEIVAVMVRVVLGRVTRQGRGVLFDGYPRNLGQLETLECILGDLKQSIDLSIALVSDERGIIERLTGRRTCRECQRVYHLRSHPPRAEGICDDCGGELLQRPDDREEAIVKRFDEYRAQTAPLLDSLRADDRLKEVPADGSIEEIQSRIVQVVEAELALKARRSGS